MVWYQFSIACDSRVRGALCYVMCDQWRLILSSRCFKLFNCLLTVVFQYHTCFYGCIAFVLRCLTVFYHCLTVVLRLSCGVLRCLTAVLRLSYVILRCLTVVLRLSYVALQPSTAAFRLSFVDLVVPYLVLHPFSVSLFSAIRLSSLPSPVGITVSVLSTARWCTCTGSSQLYSHDVC
mgnify:CR=1 FL=1